MENNALAVLIAVLLMGTMAVTVIATADVSPDTSKKIRPLHDTNEAWPDKRRLPD